MSTSGGKKISEVMDKAGRCLAVTYRQIAALKLDPNNPRAHTPRQIKQIARSIETFGFIVPAVVDADGNIIAGHGRIFAALQLGLTEVPTISVDHLSKAHIKAFQIADNRLTENSTWNERLLGEQLKFLAESELDFSIEATGFATAEIDMHIEGLAEQPEDDDPADALPEMRTGPPVTQLGDRWLLGDSVVGCADALDDTSYQSLMRTERAAMAFIDTPFNVPIKGHVSGLGAIRHREFAMGCGEMNSDQFGAFLIRIFSLLARYSVDGAIHFICMDWRHIAEVLAAAGQVYTKFLNLCVWTKNHTGMGAFYRSRHELIFVYKHGHAKHRNNIMLGKYGRDRTNVWSYPSPRTLSEEGNLLGMHPTPKSVRMVADAILDCTSRGDIVLDSTLGSGTSLIAAERTGRRCFGLELDPVYVDTIVKRWQAYTGEQARSASSGKSFNELEAEAEERDAR
jgi:DNA modification methylase